MRINEVIVVDPQLDEISAFGAGSGIGKVAGNVVGGVKDFWAGAKQGYKDARAGFVTGQGAGGAATTSSTTTSTPPAGGNQPSQPSGGQAAAPATQAAPATGGSAPAAQASGQAVAPAAQAAPQAAAQPDELEQLKSTIAKLTPQQKQEVSAALQAPAAQQQPKNDVDAVSDQEIAQSTAGRTDAQLAADAAKTNLDPRVKAAVDAEIQKRKSQKPAAAQQPAAPAGTSVDIGQVKQQSAQQAQAAQADKQTAQSQVAATQAANAEKAKQDAAIKAAKDAAMAKPAFQQTASDKLAIQKAQQMGIREAVSESKQPKKPAPKQPAKKPSPGKKKKVMVEFNSKFLGRKI